jgi:hypothetical protein
VHSPIACLLWMSIFQAILVISTFWWSKRTNNSNFHMAMFTFWQVLIPKNSSWSKNFLSTVLSAKKHWQCILFIIILSQSYESALNPTQIFFRWKTKFMLETVSNCTEQTVDYQAWWKKHISLVLAFIAKDTWSGGSRIFNFSKY